MEGLERVLSTSATRILSTSASAVKPQVSPRVDAPSTRSGAKLTEFVAHAESKDDLPPSRAGGLANPTRNWHNSFFESDTNSLRSYLLLHAVSITHR